jgi:hypothetical protein
MKKFTYLSFTIMALWLLLPTMVKFAEESGAKPNWDMFAIIWFVMGIPMGIVCYFFYILEKKIED